ncbi:MAG TPA: class I SAM-dependent methyltransferase [Candidatus Acidoferrum sp.]|nr:class I SAM-dependent methyltransferase [Candidatus Acidoferrum sp.]
MVVSLPGEPATGGADAPKDSPWLRHSACAYVGLRPAMAQHTAEEHAALKKWAAGMKCVVEIGVAEGVSALALREGMAEDATLYLIDPFHLSRLPILNFIKRVARRTVNESRHGKVVWIEKFSQDVAKDWKESIDLILIDGDHAEPAVERDWQEWSGFVRPGGTVIFHDARVFEKGWTTPDYGPVKLVNRLFRNGGVAGWTIAEEIHSLFIARRNK